ncbi:MAG: hypothetical protein E7632_06180 [Ruminococcaceae bacterium]|nr:hypothetical protein [Oscillospiraceae bacterium]
MKNRSISMSLAVLLLASLLASCGEGATSTDTTASGGETTANVDPSTVCNLPDTNWGGREFRVLGFDDPDRPQFVNFEIWAEAENGDVVNDAIYRRNTAVEDKFNVKIVQDLVATGDRNTYTLAHMRTMALAGEDLYDLAFCNLAGMGSASREGLFYDLNDVEHIDFSKEWWNPDVNDAVAVNGRVFFTSSDFSLRDKNRAYLLVFNKDMAKQFSLGNYYDMVRDGAWTLDKMAEGCKAAANDLNGDGKVDCDDSFGLTMDSYNAGVAMAVGAGVRSIQQVDGELVLAINNEHTVDVLDKVLSITVPDYVTSSCEEWQGKKIPFDSHWSFSGGVFEAGRALFTTAFPHMLKDFSAGCSSDYGILPFPKYDEAQAGYYNHADVHCMLFGIPSTTPDPDFAGFVLEALSYEASTTSLPAYIEISCKTKYTYDPDSADMLDMIFSSVMFDSTKIYGIGGIGDLMYNTVKKGSNSFASDYASLEESALADLEKLIEDIGAVE